MFQNNQPQIPQKHITVIDSEALMDFDMAMERDRVLQNYQVMLPDELRDQMGVFRKKMSTQEKEEFKHFMAEADRYVQNDTRQHDKEAADHRLQFVQLRKMMKELETKAQTLAENDPERQTIQDSIQSLSQQADEAKRLSERANDEYHRHKERNKIKDPQLHEVQKEALYHQMKGNLGETTLMGMHPTLMEFQQHHMQELQMQPNPNQRIAPGFTEMTDFMKVDPATDGSGMVWPLDAGGDMTMNAGTEAEEKRKNIQKMGFQPGQTKKIKKKKVLSKQVDPISENWRQDREALRNNPNHNINLQEIRKESPYSLDHL